MCIITALATLEEERRLRPQILSGLKAIISKDEILEDLIVAQQVFDEQGI